MNKILKTNVIKKQWKPSDISRNEVFIQMIHEKFRKQLFGDIQAGPVAPDKLLRVKKGLANHGLWKIGKVRINYVFASVFDIVFIGSDKND